MVIGLTIFTLLLFGMERNRICCINVFLLSNEGAHAYNGNGTLFTKQRREERMQLIRHDELEPDFAAGEKRIVIQNIQYNNFNAGLHGEMKPKLVDVWTQCDTIETDNPSLPVDVLSRKPSDKEICRMAPNIGPGHRRQLACELGLTKVELDHILEDNRTSVQRNMEILMTWREKGEDGATFEELQNAFIRVQISPGNVFNNIFEG